MGCPVAVAVATLFSCGQAWQEHSCYGRMEWKITPTTTTSTTTDARGPPGDDDDDAAAATQQRTEEEEEEAREGGPHCDRLKLKPEGEGDEEGEGVVLVQVQVQVLPRDVWEVVAKHLVIGQTGGDQSDLLAFALTCKQFRQIQVDVSPRTRTVLKLKLKLKPLPSPCSSSSLDHVLDVSADWIRWLWTLVDTTKQKQKERREESARGAAAAAAAAEDDVLEVIGNVILPCLAARHGYTDVLASLHRSA